MAHVVRGLVSLREKKKSSKWREPAVGMNVISCSEKSSFFLQIPSSLSMRPDFSVTSTNPCTLHSNFPDIDTQSKEGRKEKRKDTKKGPEPNPNPPSSMAGRLAGWLAGWQDMAVTMASFNMASRMGEGDARALFTSGSSSPAFSCFLLLTPAFSCLLLLRSSPVFSDLTADLSACSCLLLVVLSCPACLAF